MNRSIDHSLRDLYLSYNTRVIFKLALFTRTPNYSVAQVHAHLILHQTMKKRFFFLFSIILYYIYIYIFTLFNFYLFYFIYGCFVILRIRLCIEVVYYTNDIKLYKKGKKRNENKKKKYIMQTFRSRNFKKKKSKYIFKEL